MHEKDLKWFYNLVTGEAEQGQNVSLFQRLGPYDSREAALEAVAIAKQRVREAEEYDRKFRDDYDEYEDDELITYRRRIELDDDDTFEPYSSYTAFNDYDENFDDYH
ncbi:hypothetical protein [Corynebacterium sp. HS2168-gen11]|uniref:hypothetical protein n=1 Tax=Corynebacterium sp. HS2168-gen11 TaxID=2974027 RepID=UPI00216B51FC|nr:hypothetical protein [Corynebacterium sp. HS2168-gen11]MCS4535442.1 hypothetical protein [Corynebacterium sp. HS2168-gen11]